MEELLRRIVEQNERLIEIGERNAALLENIRFELETSIGTQLTLMDSSTGIDAIVDGIDRVEALLQELVDK